MNAQTSTTLPVVSVAFDCWLNSHCTYFRTSDVTPVVTENGQKIEMLNGRGASRSWGSPSVKSYAYRITDTVIGVDVTGWHKHTVGPVGGTYYFVSEGGKWVRRTANHKAVKAALAAQAQMQTTH